MDCVHLRFCSVCKNSIPSHLKQCANCTPSEICYYTLLPFEDHLKEIFSSKYNALYITEGLGAGIYVHNYCVESLM